MALTQEQWLKKIRSFIPTWWFEDEKNQLAHAYALAELMRQIELDAEEHIAETYIGTATGLAFGGSLDDHGDERNTLRITDEFDSQYRVRVQSLKNQSNCPDLKALIDQLLMVGEAEIREDFDSALFMDRESFMDRGDVLLEDIVNVFTVIVDEQKHDPYSFADREYFLDREEFMGTSESSQYVFDLISEALNKSKAEGTRYRVIERLNAA